MSDEGHSTFNLRNEEEEDDSDDLIEIQLTSNQIEVNFSKLNKFCKLIRDDYTILQANEDLSPLIQKYEEQYQIMESNIILFFRFIQDGNFKVNSVTYFDLYKLSTLFKVKKFKKALEKFATNHSKDVSFIINLLFQQKSMKDFGVVDSKENNEELMNILIDRCDECISNKNLAILPVNTIYEIIDKADHQKINNDDLYNFIVESIEDRYILLPLLDISKISDDNYADIYEKYLEEQKSSETNYYKEIGQNIENYKKFKDYKRTAESEMKKIVDETEKAVNDIDSLRKRKKNLKIETKDLTKQTENLRILVDQTDEKNKYLEEQLKESNDNKRELDIYHEIVNQFIHNSNDLNELRISGISKKKKN